LRVIRWQAFCAHLRRYTLIPSQLTLADDGQWIFNGHAIGCKLQLCFLGARDTAWIVNSPPTTWCTAYGTSPSNVLPAPVVTISSRSGVIVKTCSHGLRKRHWMATRRRSWRFAVSVLARPASNGGRPTPSTYAKVFGRLHFRLINFFVRPFHDIKLHPFPWNHR
jgi:hypothetical protein